MGEVEADVGRHLRRGRTGRRIDGEAGGVRNR